MFMVRISNDILLEKEVDNIWTQSVFMSEH